jgi:hypothetical protein
MHRKKSRGNSLWLFLAGRFKGDFNFLFSIIFEFLLLVCIVFFQGTELIGIAICPYLLDSALKWL